MILLDILRFILVFPFVILLVLKYLGYPRKQRNIIVAPVYFYTFIRLTAFVFDDLVTLSVIASFLLLTFIISYRLIKNEYKNILANHLVRKYFFVFARMFPIYYVLIVIIGIIKY